MKNPARANAVLGFLRFLEVGLATSDEIREVLSRSIALLHEQKERQNVLIDDAVALYEKSLSMGTSSASETFKRASDRLLVQSEAIRQAMQLAENVVAEATQLLSGAKIIGDRG